MKDIFLVIESYKGSERVVFAGPQKDCNEMQDQLRAELIKERGEDILTVKDFYVQNSAERDAEEERFKDLETYKKTLTEEELQEEVIINGKKFAKWVIDFNEKYDK